MFQLMLLSFFGCAQEPALMRDQRCLQNDLDACYEIGMAALALSRPDIGTARREFAKACQMSHHPASCNELAKMARDARGGPRDLKRAAELFAIACEKGDIQPACVNLGRAKYDGEGTKVDQAGAAALFESACKHPEDPRPMGCAALGIAYSDGVGVEKDLQKSEDLYRHACDDDYAPACVLAGDVYENIKRGKKTENLTTALTFYDRACAIDHNFGCYEYAELHQSGKPAESSDNKAAEYFQKTCTIDPTRGCYEAAQLMEDGRVKASPTEIEALYNNACEHGNTAACDKRMIP